MSAAALPRPPGFPYRLPPADVPLRVLFAGDAARYGQAALHGAAGGISGAFADTGRGGLRLDGPKPHVVVALGPPFPAPEQLRALGALTIAVDARHRSGDAPPEPAGDLAWADRVIVFDPARAELAGAWRSVALPVDDRLYAPVRRAAAPPRVVFIGASTRHREAFLGPAKHDYDILHVTGGVFGDELRALLARTDVGLNVHREAGAGFEHRALVHLAAGHLLVSEPLAPSHGLEPGIDHLVVPDRDQLHSVIGELRRDPQRHARVRTRGRLKAEHVRASRVWPRIVGDAVRDVAAS